jgi:hypothetical protein
MLLSRAEWQPKNEIIQWVLEGKFTSEFLEMRKIVGYN